MSDLKPQNDEIQFMLDGETVSAGKGETVLSVARRHGIDIPALCHHESVSPSGACRLCLVEAFWGKRSKLVTSCIYTPWADERIETNSDRVRRARAIVLELLLARCPDAEGIHDLAREYGIVESRFRSRPVEANIENCILCGLCVRVCAEVVGQHAIGYAGRGTDRVISTPFGTQADECTGCGACVFVCPTGALHYQDIDGQRIMTELNTRVPMVDCRVCGQLFATEKQVNKVREKLNLTDELARTCPGCRGSEFRVTLERCLISKNASSNAEGVGQLLVQRSAPHDKE